VLPLERGYCLFCKPKVGGSIRSAGTIILPVRIRGYPRFPFVRLRISCCLALQARYSIYSHLQGVPNSSTQHGRNTAILCLFWFAAAALNPVNALLRYPFERNTGRARRNQFAPSPTSACNTPARASLRLGDKGCGDVSDNRFAFPGISEGQAGGDEGSPCGTCRQMTHAVYRSCRDDRGCDLERAGSASTAASVSAEASCCASLGFQWGTESLLRWRPPS
jgi:hypothetical protein